MRWKGTLVGLGLVLLAGTACANQGTESTPAAGSQSQSSVTPTSSTSAEPLPQPSEVPGGKEPVQPGVAAPVPAAQLDGSALPEGYSKDVSVSGDGRTLFIRAEEGGCAKVSAELEEQNAQRVVVNLVQTQPPGNQICTQVMRYPLLTVTLGEPLGQRTVVLLSERRK